jgi:hypothetical protein
MSGDSSVGIVTSYVLNDRSSIAGRGKWVFSVLQCPDQVCIPPSLHGTSLWVYDHRRMKLTTHTHLVPMSRMVDLYTSTFLYLFIFFFFYTCCSHLEHRASVKSFILLQFLNRRQLVGLLGRKISPSQGRYLIQTQKKKHKLPYLEWDSNPRPQCWVGKNISCAAIVIGSSWLGA